MTTDQAETGTTQAVAEPSANPVGAASASNSEVERILKISVPLIARLASRPMSIAAIRRLAPGSIIEFDKSVDEDLELMVNNRPIGLGTCVKVGEKFGLRITKIVDRMQRIRSLGR